MDQDTIRHVLEATQYKPLSIDWEPILWLFGVFCLIIGGLITWLWTLGRAYIGTIIQTTNKHEVWILQQQRELSEWSKTTHTAIELIKQEQKQGQERLRIFQDNFDFGKHKKK
jgi:hypothetical protein